MSQKQLEIPFSFLCYSVIKVKKKNFLHPCTQYLTVHLVCLFNVHNRHNLRSIQSFWWIIHIYVFTLKIKTAQQMKRCTSVFTMANGFFYSLYLLQYENTEVHLTKLLMVLVVTCLYRQMTNDQRYSLLTMYHVLHFDPGYGLYSGHASDRRQELVQLTLHFAITTILFHFNCSDI